MNTDSIHPPISARQNIESMEPIIAAQERVDALCCCQQARLILTGLGGNHGARRALALAASFDSAQRLPKMALGRLLALPKNRFLALYESLQLCGAFVPHPLCDDGLSALLGECEQHGARSVEEVLALWRKMRGDILNPALSLLICEEMEAP